jgi:hypothetical protein
MCGTQQQQRCFGKEAKVSNESLQRRYNVERTKLNPEAGRMTNETVVNLWLKKKGKIYNLQLSAPPRKLSTSTNTKIPLDKILTNKQLNAMWQFSQSIKLHT